MLTEVDNDLVTPCEEQQSGRLCNSESNIDSKLSYLPSDQKMDAIQLLCTHPTVLNDVPSRTAVLEHDTDVGNATSIKQHPYNCSPAKREVMKKELNYLAENGFAKPSRSPWSSPCVLPLISDGTPRFCTDSVK